MGSDYSAAVRHWSSLPAPRQPEHDRPVGRVLVERRLLTLDQLDWALEVQGRTGSRLGEVLVSSGLVSRMDLHRALARAWNLPFVDVPATYLHPDLVTGLDPAEMSSHGWLPLHRRPDGRVLVAVSERPGPALRVRIETQLRVDVDFAVTSSWDIAKGLTTLFRHAIVEEATHGLWRRSPTQSALSVPSRRLTAALVASVLSAAVATVLAPGPTLAVAVISLAAVHVLLIGGLAAASSLGRHRPPERLGDDRLPVHTVLVPVPRGTCGTTAGSASLAATIAGLAALDYPADKLEVLLLVQEGDTATRKAVMAAGMPETVTFLGVPLDGTARSRAIACNVGLLFARGELVVVLDVGDVPDPGQLREAAAALHPRSGGDDRMVGVQAVLLRRGRRLDPFAGFDALEQAHRFGAALPGRARLGLPLPLGGPGSHVRTEVLRRLGGWDPWNDADDADLGLRAARAGLRVGVLRSAVARAGAREPGSWTVPRARELTGWMQATVVHLLRSGEGETTGLWPRLRLLSGGLAGTSLLGPAPWGVALGLLLLVALPTGVLPDRLATAAVAVVLGGAITTVLLAAGGALRAGRPGLLPLALLIPLLGLLQTAAVVVGLGRLLRGTKRPHQTSGDDTSATDTPVTWRPIVRHVTRPGVGRSTGGTAAPAQGVDRRQHG